MEPNEEDVDVSDGDLVLLGVLLTSDGGANQEYKHAGSAIES
jgi:hypothetical protein